MTGVSLEYDISAIRDLNKKIEKLTFVDTHSLFEEIGAELESQTRRRIAEEKEAPDGQPWPAWSPNYAASRHGGQSLLQGEGDLLDSIQYQVFADGSGVEWGSNLIYAATHQFGDAERGISQREYLGLSDDNADDIGTIIDDWMERQLKELE